jgi:hypothetical protein
MKEEPTIFQLAQLAAQAGPAPMKPKDAVKRAMALWSEAEAEIAENDNRIEYLRNLFWTPNGKDIPIFTDTPKDWQARLKAYPGDERDVKNVLWEKEVPAEVVEKQLFRDKKLSRDTRHTFFLALAKLCIIHDMEGPPVPYAGQLNYLEAGEFIAPQPGFPIHPKNLERAEKNYKGVGKMLIPATEVRFVEKIQAMLSKPKLYAYLVRWAVEVRQKQLAAAMSRVIPESIQTPRDRSDHDENIQVKSTYRQ